MRLRAQGTGPVSTLAPALCGPEPPPPTSWTRPTAVTCPWPPHPGEQCSTSHLELITWCVSALGHDERLVNTPTGVPRHTHTYTLIYTHSLTPPSSPGARCTWNLTFVQETCHIKGIFQKDLKGSTKLHVSEIPLHFDVCSGRLGERCVESLSTPQPQMGAC